MIYLLDTNAWAAYLNRRAPQVVNHVCATPPAGIRLCSIVKAEMLFGAYKSSRRAANLTLLALLFSQFASLDFDDAAADVYGQIRANLAALGTPIGPNFTLIAAIAVANRATLVTHNSSEFSRVPGLLIEDWEASP
jgi:tRNA(fMet)-specific endonuclease VapC